MKNSPREPGKALAGDSRSGAPDVTSKRSRSLWRPRLPSPQMRANWPAPDVTAAFASPTFGEHLALLGLR